MNASIRPYLSVRSFVSSLGLAIQFSSVVAFAGILLGSSMSAEIVFADGAGSAVRGNRPAELRQANVPLPLAFEENRGQAGGAIRFLAHGPEGVVAFTRNEVILPCDAGATGVSMTSVSTVHDDPGRRLDEGCGGGAYGWSGELLLRQQPQHLD